MSVSVTKRHFLPFNHFIILLIALACRTAVADCKDLLLSIKGSVNVRIAAETMHLTIERTPKVNSLGFFENLKLVPMRLEKQQHIKEITAAISQLQSNDSSENHKALAVALAKFFVLEKVSSVRFVQNLDGSYKFTFIDSKENIQSSLRWFSDIASF